MEAFKTKAPASCQRNAGIDLLRIIAAFYIVLLHVLGWGGVYGTTAEGSYQQAVSGFAYMWVLCGVNIFGLISGYVGYSEKEKPIPWKSLLRLWIEVVFYDVGLTLLTLWLRPGAASPADLIPMFLPILNNSHWYFTAYAILIPLLPLLNGAVRSCGRKTLLQSLTALFLFVIPFCCVFSFFRDYSFVWLLILYLVGAILKKEGFGSNISPRLCIAGIVLMNLLSYWIFHHWTGIQVLDTSIDASIVKLFLFPCHFFSAIVHLLLFTRLKFPRSVSGWITALAPGAFAVYLLNTQKHVWSGYLRDRFVAWAFSSPLGLLVRVVAISALFVTVSLIVDWLRRQLFGLFRKH